MNYSLVCTEKGSQSYQPELRPQLSDGYLLLEVQQATICGSDYMVLHGIHPYKQYPAILGHELVGKVINANGIAAFKEQQLVTALSYGFCGHCEHCNNQRYNHCSKKVTYNTAGSSGAFSKHMIVHHSSLMALPEHSNSNLFVLAEPLSIVVHAVDKVKVSSSTKLLIIGAGAMGLLSAIFSREAFGVTEIVIVEKDEARRHFTSGLGFTTFENISELEENRFDVLIVAGGNHLDFDQVMRPIAVKGTLLLISYFDSLSQFDMNIIIRKELNIIGSFLSDPIDLRQAAKMIETATARKSLLEKIITTRIHFSELKNYMFTGNSNGKVLIESMGDLE